MRYVDNQCRVYENWGDWKENNRLPMLKYCYPKDGYFTCESGRYLFDPNRDPVVEYGTSPACDVSSRILRQFDNASAITSMGMTYLALFFNSFYSRSWCNRDCFFIHSCWSCYSYGEYNCGFRFSNVWFRKVKY